MKLFNLQTSNQIGGQTSISWNAEKRRHTKIANYDKSRNMG